MARTNFSYKKHRKELEKKKKEAKRLAKAERKAAKEAGEETPEPEVMVDESGNVIEVFFNCMGKVEQPITNWLKWLINGSNGSWE